jgi:hypothetical protein
MLGVGNLRSVRVRVNYVYQEAIQVFLSIADEPAGQALPDQPSWEVIDVSGREEADLNTRLLEADASRSYMLEMIVWASSKGLRPAVFSEVVAVAQKLGIDGLKMICLGSLWMIDDVYNFANWEDGILTLRPVDHVLDFDCQCPIVSDSVARIPLPEMAVPATQ